MTVKEYLSKRNRSEQVTFIQAFARAYESTSLYHAEYYCTPLRQVEEWLCDTNGRVLNSIVLNDRQKPITWLSGADWGVQVDKGWIKCLLIISPEDLARLYPNEEQRNHMEKFIEEKMSK